MSFRYHYYNDKTWKYLYSGVEPVNIPSSATEIWLTVSISYSGKNDGFMQFEYIFGAGLAGESMRRYTGGYFYDINNYISFVFNYYPDTRNLEFDNSNSWFQVKYNGQNATKIYKFTVWYR